MTQEDHHDLPKRAIEFVAESVGGVWKEHKHNLQAQHLGPSTIKCSLPVEIRESLPQPYHLVVRFLCNSSNGTVGPSNSIENQPHVRPPVTIDLSTLSTLTDTLTRKKLIPKLIHLDPKTGALAEQFVEGQPFLSINYDNPSMVSSIARQLAYIHSIPATSLPGIDTNPTSYFRAQLQYCRDVLENSHRLDLLNSSSVSAETMAKMKEFLSFDFAGELSNFERLVNGIGASHKSRVVLCHGNYYCRKLLCPTDWDHRMLNKIRIIDVRSCAWTFRGVDMATYFLERQFNYDKAGRIKVRADADLTELDAKWARRLFVREYLKEFRKLNPDQFDSDGQDSLDRCLYDVEQFQLGRLLFHIGAAYDRLSAVVRHKSSQQDNQIEKILELAKAQIQLYQNIKLALHEASLNKQFDNDQDNDTNCSCTIL